MTGRDLLTTAIVLALFGFLVVYAGDDDGLRGLAVKEIMRDPGMWQNGGYDSKPALTKDEMTKILYPKRDDDLRKAEAGTLDAAGQRRIADRLRASEVILTEDERDAVEVAVQILEAGEVPKILRPHLIKTFRGLLERTKGGER